MNININIGAILAKAWKITWKFKVLWIFGILAGCGASNRGNFNNSFNSGSSGNNPGNLGRGNLPEPLRRFLDMDWQQAIASFLSQYWIIIAIAVLLLCIIWFVVYFLAAMGKTGLIKGAHKADLGAEKLGFGELWHESLPYFWRLFGLSLLVGLPIFILVVILLVVFVGALAGFLANGRSGADGAAVGGMFAALGVFIPAICCLGIASIFIGMIVEQAKIAMVIENLGVLESLSRGWNVFKRNFLTIIIVSIILAVISGIIGFVIAIPLLLAVLPAFLSFFMLASKSANTAAAFAPLVFAGICFIAYLPVLLVLRGIEQTYTQSALTLTYLRLTTPAPELPLPEPLMSDTPPLDPPAQPLNAQ